MLRKHIESGLIWIPPSLHTRSSDAVPVWRDVPRRRRNIIETGNNCRRCARPSRVQGQSRTAPRILPCIRPHTPPCHNGTSWHTAFMIAPEWLHRHRLRQDAALRRPDRYRRCRRPPRPGPSGAARAVAAPCAHPPLDVADRIAHPAPQLEERRALPRGPVVFHRSRTQAHHLPRPAGVHVPGLSALAVATVTALKRYGALRPFARVRPTPVRVQRRYGDRAALECRPIQRLARSASPSNGACPARSRFTNAASPTAPRRSRSPAVPAILR